MTRSATSSLARKAPGLPEHGVDQGGLAVVDVGDDGDVSQWARAHDCHFFEERSASGDPAIGSAGEEDSPGYRPGCVVALAA